jgi:hypothetical protein
MLNIPKGQSRAQKLGIPKPLKAIREKCCDCSGGSEKEVRECPIKTCALWSYRMGKYPKVQHADPT